MHRYALLLLAAACGGDPDVNVVGQAPDAAATVWVWQLTEGSAVKLESAAVAEDGSFGFQLDASGDAFMFEALTGAGEVLGRSVRQGVPSEGVVDLPPMDDETSVEGLVAVAVAEGGEGPVSVPDLRSRVDVRLAAAVLAADDVDAAAALLAAGIVAAQDAEVAAYRATGVSDDIASWASAEASATDALDAALNAGGPQAEEGFRAALFAVAEGKGVDGGAWMEAEIQASLAMRLMVRDGDDRTFANQARMGALRHEGLSIAEGVNGLTNGDAIASEFLNAGNAYTDTLLNAQAVPACISAHNNYSEELVGRTSAKDSLIAFYLEVDGNGVGPIDSALNAARNAASAYDKAALAASASSSAQASTESQRLFGEYRNLVGGVAGTFLDPFGNKAATGELLIVAATGGMRGTE